MLEPARQLSQSAQLKVDYRVATAEDTGLPSASADVVTNYPTPMLQVHHREWEGDRKSTTVVVTPEVLPCA